MSEDYLIVSRARGEPLPEGCTGVRVRVQLSGCPSQPGRVTSPRS